MYGLNFDNSIVVALKIFKTGTFFVNSNQITTFVSDLVERSDTTSSEYPCYFLLSYLL